MRTEKNMIKEIKSKHSRSGDINFRPIKELPSGLKEIKHDGSHITARGEATGSVHKLAANKVSDMRLMTDEKGEVYLEVLNSIKHTHTHDHETITIFPGIYKRVPEREIDNFSSEYLVRRVMD